METSQLVTISNARALSGRSVAIIETLAKRGIIRTEKRNKMTFYFQQDLEILKRKYW
jgi:hypothetical protein